MKLNAMMLYIDDRFPEIGGLAKMLERGRADFRKATICM